MTDKKERDYVGLAAGIFASAEASEAQAGVNQLRGEIQSLKKVIDRQQKDIDRQKYDQQYQKWAEELIYQFNKTVTAISTSPKSSIHDYSDITSFLDIIKENKLSTSLIDVIENKETFARTLQEAQNIITRLEKMPEVQDYVHKQEQLQGEEAARAASLARARKRKTIFRILLGVYIWLAIVSVGTDSYSALLGFTLLGVGILLCLKAAPVAFALVQRNKSIGGLMLGLYSLLVMMSVSFQFFHILFLITAVGALIILCLNVKYSWYDMHWSNFSMQLKEIFLKW